MEGYEIHSVLNRLYKYSDFEKRRATPYNTVYYHLDNIRLILNGLGNPQNSFRSIHIAGTKGKGSCAFFAAHTLIALGYHTGHTVSPQLIDERDRFFVGGEKASWEEIIPVFDEVLQVVEKSNIIPTVFDLFTAVAFLWFKKCKVEIAIVETGLGGRLDSTNILSAEYLLADIITSIGFDHMDKLGDTLVKIAEEKAGIIKPKVPVFTSNTDPNLVEVFRKQVDSLNAPFYLVNTEHPLLSEALAEIKNEKSSNNFFITPAAQANFNLTITTLVTLGYLVSVKIIKDVLKKLPILGRYQKHKNILIDGAHTPESIAHLVKSIQLDPYIKNFKQIKVFFYALYDKDIKGMISHIPSDWELSFFDCELHFIKSERVQEIKKRIDEARGLKTKNIKTIQEIDMASHSEVLHVFCGSFKLVGEVLAYLEEAQVSQNVSKVGKDTETCIP